jgi:hypothetical protein
MPRDEMGMPEDAAPGARTEVPVRLTVPTSDGTMHFETLVELVHPGPRERWKRPARLTPLVAAAVP